MILTSSPPAVSSSSSALILTGPLLFQPLRGLPRFPCVRNHPPTCCSRQGPKTVKLNTESLWAAGRVLMKDSVSAERITNARLLDTVLQGCNAGTCTHTFNTHAGTHLTYAGIVTLCRLTQPRPEGQQELWLPGSGSWIDR